MQQNQYANNRMIKRRNHAPSDEKNAESMVVTVFVEYVAHPPAKTSPEVVIHLAFS